VSALEAVHETFAPPAAGRMLQGLYERHADRVFGFCRRRLRSQQEAEDAVQTTFLQAFRALQRGVVPVSEQAWLFKIAENVCLSVHRSNGRRSERELADGASAIDTAPARESSADALVGLEEALAAIPPRQRDVFVLRELRGLSYREIASRLDLSVTSVEMLVFRARRSLARALENGAGLKGRVASVFDLAAVANSFKTVFAGTAAAKTIATAAAVVAVTALPAADSPRRAATAATVADPAPSSTLRAPRTARAAAEAAPRRAGSPLRPRAAANEAKVSPVHRGRPRRPRPDVDRGSPGAPPTGGSPSIPQAPGAPQQPPAAAPVAPSVPAPSQTPVAAPTPPEVPEPPQLPQLPQAPAVPVEVPLELPLEVPAEVPALPDPGELELPAIPTVP
jgi:RNA polymerase sigma factor (sigma-70 family)